MAPKQVTIEDWDSDGAIRIPDDVLQALSVDVGSILYMNERRTYPARAWADRGSPDGPFAGRT